MIVSEEQVLSCLRLAQSIVNRYAAAGRAAGIEREDLVGWAYLGLAKAARDYDSALGFKFCTLAGTAMRHEILHALRDYGAHGGNGRRSLRKTGEFPPPTCNVDDHEAECSVELPPVEDAITLERMLALCSPLQARCVRARYLRGLEYDQIGQRYGLTPQGASASVQNGLKRLRRAAASLAFADA